MFERKISPEDVHHIINTGEVIENYPEDKPYPSRLILGSVSSRPVHIVVANNRDMHEIMVITVYEPDPTCWDSTLKRRKGK